MRLPFLLLVVLTCLISSNQAQAAIVVGFEERTAFTGNAPAGGGQFYNGNNGNGVTNSNGWVSGGVFFNNSYFSQFDYWEGWAYSNVANSSSASFLNQYAAFPGGGANGSTNYALAYNNGAYFNLPNDTQLVSVSLANSTYVALSMRNGDAFSKKFGGASGNDPDFFRVSLNGFDGLGGTGSLLGSITVPLADFTFADSSQDYILADWLTVDLSSIATARSIALRFSSSDTGAFGINTPTYVALDNLTLTVVPEPSSLALLVILGAAVTLRRRGASRASRLR
jgi:hypothetical protein